MNISREHIAFTLGIPIPLNESVNVSESLRLRIIHEQLIYESFSKSNMISCHSFNDMYLIISLCVVHG